MAVPVITTTTSILEYRQFQTWRYQPRADQAINVWACPGLPEGMSIDPTTGLISGAALVPGVYVCTLSATNTVPQTGSMVLTIGIEPVSGVGQDCPTIFVNGETGALARPDGNGNIVHAASGPLISLTQGDVIPLIVRFHKQGTFYDPQLTSLKLTLKLNEPEGIILSAGGNVTSDIAAPLDVQKFGDGDSSFYVFPVAVTGAEIANALAEFESDAGTFIYAIAELERKKVYPFAASPAEAVITSNLFVARIVREMTPN